jgi:hypothetical protein
MKKATLFLLFGIMIFLGCRKENQIEIPAPVAAEKQYRWKLDSNFIKDNAVIANSFATENELYLYGKYFSVVTFDKNNKELVENYQLRGEPNTNFKMPISETFFINTFQRIIVYFIPTQGPVTEYNTSSYRFGNINPNLTSDLFFPSYKSGQCMAINKKNQALIPYTTSDPSTNTYSNALNFVLSDVNVIYEGQRATITKTKSVSINDADFGLSNLFTHKDYFIANLRSTNYKIYTDGTVKQIYRDGAIRRIIAKNDTLYAFSNSGDILRSTNDAEDWVKLSTENPNISNFNYYIMDNEIIGTNMNQLYHFVINGNNLVIKEIDNDQLVTPHITSISKFKDKVFVTTMSGVYIAEHKSFFKYKL